jgi:hypothetical protein
MKATICVLLLSVMMLSSTRVDNWEIFARVKFTPKFFKEVNEYFLFPKMNAEIKALEGKTLTLTGYYLPYDLPDENSVVLSRYPFSSCFFCGGAGPESVAEIVFTSGRPKIKADKIVTVTGTLKLNDSDINHLNFILKSASIKTQ